MIDSKSIFNRKMVSNKMTYQKLRFPVILLKKLCTYGIKTLLLSLNQIFIFLCALFAQ